MRIYLDDDHANPLLTKLLRRDGHDVLTPAEHRTSGAHDPIHLTAAIRERRALLTGNHDDFRELHELILAAAGDHGGILVVRKDNDKARDLSVSGIVRAVRNLEASGSVIARHFHVLNAWR